MPSHNPLVISLPYTFSNQDVPTEIMANRFSAWRSIIKDLVNYFKEYSSVQEEIIRQQSRLQQAVGQITNTTNNNSNYNNNTTPNSNGSVQDIPNALFKFHQKNVVDGTKTLKDINGLIIPKLEELRKDLLVKIKEIKNLQNDFKNNLSKELNDSKSLISQYNQAIELANKLGSTGNFSHITTLHEADSGKSDPYLVKIRLERQLKRQLVEENYLYDAYANLQNAGRQLESIVVLEVQNYVSINGFLSKESNFEWDAFIERNLPNVNNHGTISSGTFIDLNIPKRHLSDFVIKNFDSNLNVAIREGYLERRSKFLKNYTSAWYVLTCSYIHEFKSNDRKKDPQPVMSLPLDSCTVSDHSKNDGKLEGVYKFILTSKSHNTLMNKTHKWVFRTNTYQNMIEWFDSIKKMTSLPTPATRARTIEGGHGNSNNGKTNVSDITSGHSISRVSSTNTARSPARSLKTVSTNTTSASQAYKHRSLNQVSSSHKRLSSTFSQRNNNQSPRLTNMINSDGTIITPVDTDEDSTKRSSRIYQQQKQQQQQQQQPQQQGPSTPNQQPGPYHLIPVDTMGNQQPQQQQQQQQQQFVNPPAGYQYYIPSNAQQGVQQFYDPVQQQYYTITPTVPVNSNSSNNQQPQQQQQAPQPQYFSTSPLPTPQLIPGSPVAPAFGQYFQQPQFVQQKQQQQQQQKDGGLPYPTMSRTTSIYNNDDTITDEQIPKSTAQQQKQDQGKGQLGSSLYPGQVNGERPGQGISQLSNEEVSTLNSNVESNPRNAVKNNEHTGDISIEVTPGKD
ncbi:PH domain family protein [Candida albicans]|uniref:PH domain family protein n=1 Tax=Candida albicans TaxID=5476 RepID=A0A8H6C1K6_CANAX|nr:PH domain family protein [Candida albicans]